MRGTYSSFGTCRSCGSQIIWVKTKSGKNMPCNTSVVSYMKGGPDKIVTPNGDVISGTVIHPEPGQDFDGCGYISHFATCPNADRHRRRKT